MKIDTTFNFSTDSKGRDPDSASPTLQRYHRLLWSKRLPDGSLFDLHDEEPSCYLHHSSELGTFSLGSDAITHSYKNQNRKQWLIKQIPDEAEKLYDAGLTIGAYIIFPDNRIDRKQTINQARGINALIDDRFDLTLECIRRYYKGINSPLYETLARYKKFFDLFIDFQGYVHFFLLQDLIDETGGVSFYLPFKNFTTRPTFSGVYDYLIYKEKVMQFIDSRNKRISAYAASI